ncbi:hypothetical protein [Burkholderia sp. Se-20378]|uniref:hypothetical protein n=1 Tax=Burkholderia sp. Se-20378 TaxID=2703899 RepID=UPI0019818814|nr:hypothetical protein [Burkholderia sp. Se-20378]MBN3773154.1 hypothetical protein [Burkholderia sp. Se-20378]
MNLHTAGLVAKGFFVIAAYAALKKRAPREQTPLATRELDQRLSDMGKAVIKLALFFAAVYVITQVIDAITAASHHAQ